MKTKDFAKKMPESFVPFLKTFKVYYSSDTTIKIEMLDIYYV